MLHESREMNAPSENDAKYNETGSFDMELFQYDNRMWRLNKRQPQENDKKYYEAGSFDEEQYVADYNEWEQECDETHREYREAREAKESAPKPKRLIRKITIAEENNITTIIPPRVAYERPAIKSSSAVSSAQKAIMTFVSDEKEQILNDPKMGLATTITKQLSSYEPDIEKIRHKMDSRKEAMSETMSEKRDRRTDIIKAQIDGIDAKIQNREKQVEDSENKVERIRSSQIPIFESKYDNELSVAKARYDDEIARAKAKYDAEIAKANAEYDAKVNATEAKRRASIEKLNEEAERSRQYAEGVKAEIAKLEAQKLTYVGKLDKELNVKVRLAPTEYAKLSMCKTRLENELGKINDWFKDAERTNRNLIDALETLYNQDIHKIDEDIIKHYTFLDYALIAQTNDKTNTRYDYMNTQYSKLHKKVKTALTQVNELLNNSEADEDYTYNGDD